VLYGILRAINEWYAIVVLWVYVLLFFAALGLIFVFPPAPLAMVFLGVVGLGLANVVSKALHGLQHAVARRMINHGECPRCRQTNQYGQPEDRFICVRCNTVFLPRGDEVDANLEQPRVA